MKLPRRLDFCAYLLTSVFMNNARSEHNEILESYLKDGARSLIAAYDALPTEQGLAQDVEDAKAANARGYYSPDEDERLRVNYVHYMAIRAGLWETVQSLLPYIELPKKFNKEDYMGHLRAFAIAFACSAMLVRSGYYLIDIVDKYKLTRTKLDEAEPRYNIERKQFSAIYDSLTSTRRMRLYHKSLAFYIRNRHAIYASLDEGLYTQIADILRNEQPYLERRFSKHFRRKAKYRLFSFRRRNSRALHNTMFFLFEQAGSEIAEMKQPLVKPRGAGKRITDDVRAQLLELVQPGDVFVTRHDDAMSNLFLPGFWPHAALFIGTDAQRASIGVGASDPEHQSIPGEVRFLESKKDGVLFRPAHDTLQVDACVILRPNLSAKDLSAALTRAHSHSGKLYDFIFDFASAEKLACTELIYRTYTGFEKIDFTLDEKAGRMCLSAEDLLNQAVGNNWFEVVALYGVGNDILHTGKTAKKRLIGSFEYLGAG